MSRTGPTRAIDAVTEPAQSCAFSTQSELPHQLNHAEAGATPNQKEKSE